jgi:hypothetical protein
MVRSIEDCNGGLVFSVGLAISGAGFGLVVLPLFDCKAEEMAFIKSALEFVVCPFSCSLCLVKAVKKEFNSLKMPNLSKKIPPLAIKTAKKSLKSLQKNLIWYIIFITCM